LSEFRQATGLETNGVLVDLGIFIDAEEPALGPYLGDGSFPPPYPPGSEDLRLVAGTNAIDQGAVLPNINDGFAGSAPDLGAYELGQSIPVYGPGGGETTDVHGDLPDDPPGSATPPVWLTPNPAAGWVMVHLELLETASPEVNVFSIDGRRVRSLSPGRLDPGEHELAWDRREIVVP
jgi:hypothetical protein